MGWLKHGRRVATAEEGGPVDRPAQAPLTDEEKAALQAKVAELRRDPVLYDQVRELFDLGLIHGWRSLHAVHVPER